MPRDRRAEHHHYVLSHYLTNDEPPVSARLFNEAPSSLSSSSPYQFEHCLGVDLSETRTSRIVNGSDFTDNGSLPALTKIPYSTPESVTSTSCLRAINHNLRIFDDNGEVTTLPPSQTPVLECPFDVLGCVERFAMGQGDAWFKHSLEHFMTREPPTRNKSPFCDLAFFHHNAVESWRLRMEHVAAHHGDGHSLRTAMPDFDLLRHLWQQRVLNNVGFRELWDKTPDLSRGQLTQPLNPVPDIDEGSEVYTVVNERSRPRKPRA